jgi:hypothetical protein
MPQFKAQYPISSECKYSTISEIGRVVGLLPSDTTHTLPKARFAQSAALHQKLVATQTEMFCSVIAFPAFSSAMAAATRPFSN